MATTSTSTTTPPFQNPFQQQTDQLTQASQAAPVTQEFDESKSSASRVNDIIRQDSALMQTARTRAAQDANAKGLLNSSLAVQSGQQAVINTATPLATTDAQLSQQQSLANQQAKNSAAQFNASQRAQVGTAGLQLGVSQSQFDADTALKRDQLAQQGSQFNQQQAQQQRQFDAQQAQQITLQNMDAASRLALVQAEGAYKSDIQGNQNIAQAWGTMQTEIGKIQNNPDLEPAAKQTMIANQIASFQSFTTFWKKLGTGTTADVSDLLNFGVTSGGAAGGPAAAAPAPAPGYAPAPAPVPGQNPWWQNEQLST